MGPMVWWWRWWMGMDPNRDQRATGAQTPAEHPGGATATQTGPPPTDAALVGQLREEASQLRAQITDLTTSGMEADRLRAELDQVRAEAAELRAQRDEAHAETERLRAELDRVDGELRTQLEQQHAESERLRAELERADAEGAAMRARLQDLESPVADETPADETPADEAPGEPATRAGARGSPDIGAAASILGASISRDDLTVVDGVGPKIAGLLSDAGIDTWRELAAADVDRLREVLADAGPRYRMHDPSTWAAQAELLAEGRWQEFKDLKED